MLRMLGSLLYAALRGTRLQQMRVRVPSNVLRLPGLVITTIICIGLGGPEGSEAQDTLRSAEPVRVSTEDRIDIDHLTLAIDGTSLAEGTFTGTARYRLRSEDVPLRTLELRAANLEIRAVELTEPDTTAEPTTFQQSSRDSLTIELGREIPPDTTFALTIDYRGSTGPGLQVETTSDGSLDAAWTTGTPGTNRFWFPTWERLTDGFTTELEVILPVPLQLVASGTQVSGPTEANDVRTFRYRFDRTRPSHLIGFAAGRYESVRTSVQQANGESIVLEYLVPPERIGDTRRTFRATPAVVQFLADRLGVPYPWSDYRLAVVPGIRPANLHPPMTVILSDSLVIDQRASQDFPADRAVAQSTAAQWIGSLIIPETWADAWIVQGLSAYLSLSFIGHRFGDEAMLLAIDKLQREQRKAFPPHTLPLSPASPRPPVEMLTTAQRAKGARVFRMLHHRVGAEQFQAGLRRLIADYRSDALTTEELRQTFEEVSGQPLEEFFDQWVYGTGYPSLRLSYGYNASVDSLSIHVEQRPDGSQTPGAFRVDLPVTIHGLTGRQNVELEVRKRNQVLSVPLSGEPRFVEIDPLNVVPDSTHLEQPAAAWVRQLNEGTSLPSRMRAARAARRFTGDPSLPIGLKGALSNSSHPAVRAAIIRTMGALPASGTIHSTISEASRSEFPAVRRAALVAFRRSEDKSHARQLAVRAAQSDTSYRVQAAAIRTLAHLGGDNAFRIVQSAFVTPSHNEIIRRAAFDALSILDEPLTRELPLALKWSEPGAPAAVRAAAPDYLADHLDNARARQRLADLLSDPDLRVRKAAVDALAYREHSQGTRLLEQRLDQEQDPWIRTAIRSALQPG